MNKQDLEKLNAITKAGGYSEIEDELNNAASEDVTDEEKMTAWSVFNSLIIADFIKSDAQLLADTNQIFGKLYQHSQSVVGPGLRKVSVLIALGEIAGQFDFNCITNAWPSEDEHCVIPHHAFDPTEKTDEKAMTSDLLATGQGQEIDHARRLMAHVAAITRSVGTTRELYVPDSRLIPPYTKLAEEITAYWFRLMLRLTDYDCTWYKTHYSFLLAIGRVVGLELGDGNSFKTHRVVATYSAMEEEINGAYLNRDGRCNHCNKRQCADYGQHIYEWQLARINDALSLTGNDRLRLS